jgi:hypothetical protein
MLHLKEPSEEAGALAAKFRFMWNARLRLGEKRKVVETLPVAA